MAEWRARQTRRESSRAIANRGLHFLRTGQWGSKPASLGYPAGDVIAELTRELEAGVRGAATRLSVGKHHLGAGS